jgi:hypothetical protein
LSEAITDEGWFEILRVDEKLSVHQVLVLIIAVSITTCPNVNIDCAVAVFLIFFDRFASMNVASFKAQGEVSLVGNGPDIQHI